MGSTGLVAAQTYAVPGNNDIAALFFPILTRPTKAMPTTKGRSKNVYGPSNFKDGQGLIELSTVYEARPLAYRFISRLSFMSSAIWSAPRRDKVLLTSLGQGGLLQAKAKAATYASSDMHTVQTLQARASYVGFEVRLTAMRLMEAT